MIGSILGDIAGSRFEYSRPKGFDHKKVKLFDKDCFFTDDTVMTIATKYAIDNDISFAKAYSDFGKRYPNAGYGGMFDSWIRSDDKKPYNSFGNGSAMRVSYIGHRFNSLDQVRKFATESAECTHNHPEGIKGAVATAECIWLARTGYGKEQIKDYVIKEFCYDLSNTLDEIRPTYRYDVTCQGTVPEGIQCFLESEDYESCIRNVFSLMGDVDTMACIAGGIAEAFYGKTGFADDELLRLYLDDFLYEKCA